MRITAILNPRLAQRLTVFASRTGRSRADIVRESLDRFLTSESASLSAYDLALPYLGCVDSGCPDLAENHSRLIKEKLRAKHARRDRGFRK